MNLLRVNNLCFRYADQTDWLISELSLSIEKGEIIAITGDSGSGKTTLLFLLAGVIPRHRPGEIKGDINLAAADHRNNSLAQLAPHISLVMQQPDEQIFFPTVEQELAFAPENLCLPVNEIESRIQYALKILNIEDIRFSATDQLSFGQQKLVALAAIHTLQPEILLLDEISNGLASERLNDISLLIKEYAASGKAVVLADHDLGLIALADKIIKLS